MSYFGYYCMNFAAAFSSQDTSGICGGIFHYSMIFAFMGSALLAFLYFWGKGSLNMDEEAKIQMMNDDGKEF